MIKPIIQRRLLFPEILWKRPINIYQRKGRVLTLGGTAVFCEVLFYSQIQKISFGYPDVLKNNYQKILPSEITLPLPSSALKTFSYKAYEVIKKEMENYDLLIIGKDLSKNQETERLIEELLKLPFPVLLESGEYLKREHPTIFILDEKKIASNIFDLEKLVSEYNNIFVLINQRVFVSEKENIIITPFKAKRDVLLALISAFWSQNVKKPFESAVAGSYVTKTWQENFNKLSDISKALDKVEKESA